MLQKLFKSNVEMGFDPFSVKLKEQTLYSLDLGIYPSVVAPGHIVLTFIH